jgi:hypothetical protein
MTMSQVGPLARQRGQKLFGLGAMRAAFAHKHFHGGLWRGLWR